MNIEAYREFVEIANGGRTDRGRRYSKDGTINFGNYLRLLKETASSGGTDTPGGGTGTPGGGTGTPRGGTGTPGRGTGTPGRGTGTPRGGTGTPGGGTGTPRGGTGIQEYDGT